MKRRASVLKYLAKNELKGLSNFALGIVKAFKC